MTAAERGQPVVPEPADESSSPPVDEMRVAVTLEVPSDVRYIERIVSLVAHQAAELEFAPRQVKLNLPVALSEALANAMLRGNRDDRSKPVHVRATFDGRDLILEIVDQGRGFDLDDCSSIDPTLPENLLREDGRGLFLMKRLMDRVERFTRDGNVVRLTLHR
jgi:serine/threonine-protein kinase RsbW